MKKTKCNQCKETIIQKQATKNSWQNEMYCSLECFDKATKVLKPKTKKINKLVEYN